MVSQRCWSVQIHSTLGGLGESEAVITRYSMDLRQRGQSRDRLRPAGGGAAERFVGRRSALPRFRPLAPLMAGSAPASRSTRIKAETGG